MAFSSFKVSYADDLGAEVIDIYVGPERKRYVVHKNLLTSQSEYFYKAFTGSFMEAKDNSIYLKEEDPAAVALFIGWLYRGTIPGTDKSMIPFVKSIFSFPETIQIPTSMRGTIYPLTPTPVPVLGTGSLLFGNSSSSLDRLHHICAQSEYNVFSPEELRLKDYKLGQKYQGDGVLAAAPVPPQTSLPGPPFGGISTFGSSIPAYQPPSNSLVGQNPAANQNPNLYTHTSSFATGSTAPVASPNPPGSSGPLLFGSVLGGSPAPTNQSSNIFGHLSSQASGTPNNSPFGPASTSGHSQGASATTSQAPPAQAATSSLFGTPSGPTGSNLFGGLSSTLPTGVNNSNAPASTAQGSNPVASSSSTAPPISTGLFGTVLPTATSQPTGGLFGAPTGAPSNPVPFPFPPYSPPPNEAHDSIYRPGAVLPPGTQLTTIRPEKPKLPNDFGYYPSIKHLRSPRIYIKGIPQGDPMNEQFVDLEQHQVALLNLCIMAETQCWTALFNDAMSAFIRGEHRLQRPLSLDFIDRIYTRTYPESTLRLYVMDSLTRMKLEGVEDITPYMEMATKHADFLADLLGKVMGSSAPLETLTDKTVEDYYMFGMDMGRA